MAIVPETEFPGKILPGNANYPQGEARNITVSGDGTGTPWIAPSINDIWGLFQRLLSDAGITPSGNPDTVLLSDYKDAFDKIFVRKISGSFTTASLASGATESITITHGLGTDNLKALIRGNQNQGNSSEWACRTIFSDGSYIYFTGDGVGNMQGNQPVASASGDITIIAKNTGSVARAITIYYSIFIDD